MTKLEIYSAYLPYGVRIRENKNEYSLTGGWIQDNESHPCLFEDCKLILRPLSDLTKIEHWTKLRDHLIDRGIYKSGYADTFNSYKARIIEKPFGKIFKLQNHDDWVCIISLSEPDRCKALIYNWLIKNHFDVFGAIEQGIAININEI